LTPTALISSGHRQGKHHEESQSLENKGCGLSPLAETSKEVERERKLLRRAAELEARVEAIEPRAEIISPL
jgi:hypothetical protein